MWNFVLTWLVTTASLIILSRLNVGLEIKDTGTAFGAALVLGLLNATLLPILRFLAFPITFLTFGLFTFVLNAVILWIVSGLVRGFELRGCLSSILVAVLLAILNAILFWGLGIVGIA